MRHNLSDYADFYARKYRQATKHHHKRALVLTARKSVGLMVGLHRPGTGLQRKLSLDFYPTLSDFGKEC